MTHFINKISAELRQKLGAHGLLSPAAVRSSLSHRLRPPSGVRAGLLPLHGLCTYHLLDELRYGRGRPVYWDPDTVSGDIDEWFTQLRHSTSEWTRPNPHGRWNPWGQPSRERPSATREDPFDEAWAGIGRELLDLDKATRVPRDAPEVQAIFRNVKCVPTWFMQRISRRYPDSRPELFPMGSFVCDAKVVDLDEFDFLVVCGADSDAEKAEIGEYVRSLAEGGWAAVERLSGEERCILNERAAEVLTAELAVTRVHQHGPAWCVTLRWLCDEPTGSHVTTGTGRHVHEMGLDITLAWRTDTSAVSYFSGIAEQHPALGEAYGRIGEDEKLFVADDFISTALAAFRLLKVIAGLFTPKQIVHSGASSFQFDGTVNSHALKQIWYLVLDAFPAAGDWHVSVLHHRVDRLVRTLAERGAVAEFIKRASDKDSHRIEFFERRKFNAFGDVLADEFGNLRRVSDYLRGGYRTKPSPTADDEDGRRLPVLGRGGDILLISGRCVHLSDKDVGRLAIVARYHPTMFAFELDTSPMTYSQHPLVRWRHAFLAHAYGDQVGTDLRLVEYKHTPYVWLLHKYGVVDCRSLSDVTTYAKIAALRNAIGTFTPAYWRVVRHLVIVQNTITGLAAYTNTRPVETWNPLPQLVSALPLLNTVERAMLSLLCVSVVDKSPLITLTLGGAPLVALLEEDTGLIGEGMKRLMWALHQTTVALARMGDTDTEHVILLYHVVAHLVTYDEAYFKQMGLGHGARDHVGAHLVTHDEAYFKQVTDTEVDTAGVAWDRFVNAPEISRSRVYEVYEDCHASAV